MHFYCFFFFKKKKKNYFSLNAKVKASELIDVNPPEI